MIAGVDEVFASEGLEFEIYECYGRLSEPNLEEEVREVAATLIAEAKKFADLDPLAA